MTHNIQAIFAMSHHLFTRLSIAYARWAEAAEAAHKAQRSCARYY
jgi:hypothetical protein